MNDLKIPTGNGMIDIIVGGGFSPGIVNIIGDSSSGKSLLLCEAIYAAKKKFGNKVKVRYNDAESGFSFDTMEIYGYDLKEDMVKTPTIENFMADFGVWSKSIKKDEIGFYVVDSFDGLCSDADIEEYDNRIKEYEKGKDYKKGSYDMSKQKFSSKMFRTLANTIKDKNILLVIISQIRDNVGVMYGQKWTVSGGKALKFYSDFRLFLRSAEKFIVQDRQIGYCLEVTGIKTRTKWPNRQCHLNIYHEYGMDNVSSNIDYLFDLKDNNGKLIPGKCSSIHWGENAKEISKETLVEFLSKYNITEDDYKEQTESRRFTPPKVVEWIASNPKLNKGFVEEFGVIDRESLISYIEENDLEDELSQRAKKKWADIEESIKPKRKRKTL